jgi:hypothetical protein
MSNPKARFLEIIAEATAKMTPADHERIERENPDAFFDKSVAQHSPAQLSALRKSLESRVMYAASSSHPQPGAMVVTGEGDDIRVQFPSPVRNEWSSLPFGVDENGEKLPVDIHTFNFSDGEVLPTIGGASNV